MRKKIFRAKPTSNIKHSSYSVKGGVKRIKTSDYSDSWKLLIVEVKTRDNFQCVICSKKESLEVHHILPLSRGGTNSKRNLITLCHICHSKRHKHL